MTTVERRLREALMDGASRVHPAPDLFARVQGSLDDDRRRRRNVVRYWSVALVIAAVLGLVVMVTSKRVEGRLLMDWWILEVITTAVLIGIALWLGPFIKRFGRSYKNASHTFL